MPQRFQYKLLTTARLVVSLLLTTSVTVACSAPTPSPEQKSATPAAEASAGGLLGEAGLAGLDVPTIIQRLDASDDDREAGPIGSVRPTELIVSEAQGSREEKLPIPAGQFYLAVAPWQSDTHRCFHHNLASCRGELAGTRLQVTLVSADGAVVLQREVTTMGNGFAGLWVPAGLKSATLTIKALGKSVSVPVSTGPDDPTCLTTPLRLS